MSDSEIFKIPKLKGSSNFDIWSLRLESILTKDNLIDYILADYTTASNYNETSSLELTTTANKVSSLVKLSLEDGPLLQTRFIKNPYTLYTTLKNLYCAQGFSSEFILSKELINTTINSYKGNLELYINNFKRIINNLEAKGISLPSNFIAALLLNNLNKDYEYIVTIITQTIRVNNSTINIDSIIAQLLDESRRINSIKGKDKASIAYFNNNNSNNSYTSYNNASSSNSSDSSIDLDYPTNIEMSMQSNKITKLNSKKRVISCNYCNLKGHLESKCFKKYPSLRKELNFTKTINYSNLDNNSSKVETILNSSKLSSSSKSKTIIDFILDSGATIHISYRRDIFTTIRPTNTIVKWGNSNRIIKAKGIGDINVYFTSNPSKLVKIKDVLYIPSLQVNLLSLSTITKKGYKLTFNKANCFIYNANNSLLAKGSYKDSVSIFSAKSLNNIYYKPSNKTRAILNTRVINNTNTLDTSNKLALNKLRSYKAKKLNTNRLENYKAIKLKDRLESYKVIKPANSLELSKNSYPSKIDNLDTTLESLKQSFISNKSSNILDNKDYKGVLDSKASNYRATSTTLDKRDYYTLSKIVILILYTLQILLVKYLLENNYSLEKAFLYILTIVLIIKELIESYYYSLIIEDYKRVKVRQYL
jgi:hypothetical protein